MTTETRELTVQDGQQIDAAVKQLRENGFDSWTQQGINHNADLLFEYFQANPAVPVTVANIFKAVEARKQDFKWLSQAQHEWYQAAQQNPELGNQLAAHLATHGGQAGRLANSGEELFENLSLLFEQIHSRRETVSPQTVADAEDRIAHRPGRQLRRVPQPRRTEPVSAAAKADDGTPFVTSGLTKQKDGCLGKSPADYARERREARRAVYDRELGQGWRRVYEACKREVNIYRNRGFAR